MLKFNKLILSIFIVLVILQGCGSNIIQEQSLDENNTINVTVLIQGDQPVSGNFGLKKLMLIDNTDDFATSWTEYTNENLPEIDFDNQVVALYDMGGERDSNTCGDAITLTNVSAEEINTSISMISINLSKSCPSQDVACIALYLPIRPFIFVSVPKSDETLMSENITFEICD